ncbi:hypothetical protein PIB30_100812, partial [Stylosanthes scabra]|nr:hypothetical protein [Stylosanthes scabra]
KLKNKSKRNWKSLKKKKKKARKQQKAHPGATCITFGPCPKRGSNVMQPKLGKQAPHPRVTCITFGPHPNVAQT